MLFISAAVERLTGLVNNRLLQVHLAGQNLQKQRRQLHASVLKKHSVGSSNLHLLPDAEDAGAFGLFCSLTNVLFSHNHLFHTRTVQFFHSGGSVRIHTDRQKS